MNGFLKASLIVSLILLVGFAYGPPLLAEEYNYDEATSQPGVEVQTRGPVHEAFAEPVDLNPEPGIIVSKAPPAPIAEEPPAERPAEETAIWIPGYWAWDDDRDDFLWVSGIWRVPPPDYTWVPGYWSSTSDGYQWVPGFWQPVEQRHIEYLPPPPQTLEAGPSSPQPSPDYIWVPGNWVYRETRYLWRPGYWLTPRPNWVWVPAHYTWTPRGVIFVEGYWDYSLTRRGVLFAPVYFERRVYVQPRFRYVPTVVIQPGILHVHLFTRPRYDHYYFGDYYATTYVKHGIYPWFEVKRVYNPIIVHYQWEHRRDRPHWIDNVRRDYTLRTERIELRPPRTFERQRIIVEKAPEHDRRTLVIAKPLNEVQRSKDFAIRFENLQPNRRDQIARQSTEVRRFVDQRSQWERQAQPQVSREVTRESHPQVRVQPQPQVQRQVQTFKPVSPFVTRRTVDIRDKNLLPPPRPALPKTQVPEQPKTVITKPGPSVTLPPRTEPQKPGPTITGPGQQPRVITPAPVVRPDPMERKTITVPPKASPKGEPGSTQPSRQSHQRKG